MLKRMAKQGAWRAFQMAALLFFYVMCLYAADAVTGEKQYGVAAIALFAVVAFALTRLLTWLLITTFDRVRSTPR